MEETNLNKTNWIAFSLIIAFVISLAFLLGFLYLNSKPSYQNPSATTTAKINGAGKVKISSFDFEPQIIHIKKGNKVVWTNSDFKTHQVASDPYPTHTLLPELDSGELTKNQIYSFTFKEKGTFTYHDEKNPYTLKGTVVVE